MPLMPGATWRPLGPNPSIEGRMARYDVLCYHTMVGSLWGTDSYFHRDGYGGTESHWGVGYDGELLQWQLTEYRADANLDGGDRVLSVETADMGTGFPAWGGENVPAWTAAQIETNAQIAAWAYRTHGIPLRLIPDTSLDERGLGYHRQGIDPWRCASCERWSSSSGKVCPGDRRVAQMPQVLARAKEILEPEPLPPIMEVSSMLIVTPYGSSRWRAICPESRSVVGITELGYDRLRSLAGTNPNIVSVALPNADVEAFEMMYGKPVEVDNIEVPN